MGYGIGVAPGAVAGFGTGTQAGRSIVHKRVATKNLTNVKGTLMSDDKTEQLPAQREAPAGFVTQIRQGELTPAMLAEQQRAKSEIEAALTIAQARPRDEKEAMDRIMISCQRPGLAAKAQYQYARGGTDISGASIRLLEAIAQRWGNIDFGWRELSRFPGVGQRPGESMVEAYAWDLESNLKPRVQFQVQHQIQLKGGRFKVLTDPRDIFEYVSNQAMRRVRKCLEQVIPRDVVEAACEECDRTLHSEIKDLAEASQKMLAAFGELGVTKEQIEARIQRRLESITPAQLIALRKIYTSIRDGMSEPSDWFADPAAEGKEKHPSPLDDAKTKMRQQQAQTRAKAKAKSAKSVKPEGALQSPPDASAAESPPKQPDAEPATPEPPEAQTEPEAPSAPPAAIPDDVAAVVDEYKYEAEAAETLTGLRELRKHAEANAMLTAHPSAQSIILEIIATAEEGIRAARKGS